MWITRNRRNLVIGITAATLLFIGNDAAHGGDSLQSTIAELVSDLDVHLGKGERRLKVGEFKSETNATLDVYGKRLATELQTQLKSKTIEVSDNADQMIQGTYRMNQQSGDIEIRSRIVTGNGDALQVLTTVGKDGEILQTDPTPSPVAGANVPPIQDLKPKKIQSASETLLASQIPLTLDLDKQEKPAEIAQQITKAAPDQNLFMITDDRYLVLKDVNLGIRLMEINPQIQDRESPNFLGAMVIPRNTHPFLFRLHEGKRYMIELKNFRTDIDLAVKVLFDGIDSTAFSSSEEERERLMWIVSRQQSVGVYGWYRDESTTDAFRIIPDDQSLAYQMRTTANIGKIQVVVYAAWEKNLATSIPSKFFRPKTRGVGKGETMNLVTRKLNMDFGKLMGQLIVDYDTEPVPRIGAANDEVSISLVQGER